MKGLIPRDAARPVKGRRRKPRNREKPNWRLLAYLLCASALVGCLCSFALQTPALMIKRVEIRGLHYADRIAVERASETLLGRNIVLIRKGSVAGKIRRLSEVQSVRIGRCFPNGVWLRIDERRPAAVLSHKGKCYLLQEDGLAFHIRERPVPHVTVVVVGDCDSVSVGAKMSSPGVCCALKIVKSARERQLDVTKISVDRLGDICLNMGSGLYVKLGQPDEIARKMSLLKDALVYKPSLARDAAYINLSCPSAPVWRPKSSVGSAS